MKKTLIPFCCIVAIAAFLRFWHLSGVPVSPNWDEVALGYNAYSILKTGRDEYGVHFPIVLRSFNNYTPALYSYLAIPGMAILGLSVFTTRLPSAVMGVIAVIGTFFLTRELLGLQCANRRRNTNLALLTMFLLALSPWHIQFSRVAFEANPALTLCIWGLTFFLLGLNKPIWYLASAIMYGLSINAYHSPRLFVPLFVAGLAFIFREKLRKQKKNLLTPLLISGLFFLPFIYFIATNQGQNIVARFSETTIVTQSQAPSLHPKALSLLFDSKIPNMVFSILNGYLTHFSPAWLLITGDNDRHHAPSMGLLYLFEYPFLLWGLYTIIRSKGKIRSMLLLWILLSPIPASLTSEVPHAVRTLIVLPSLQIAVALGIERFYRRTILVRLPFRATLWVVSSFVAGFFMLQYLHLYFYEMNLEESRFWQFGYEHAVNYVLQNKQKYQHIVVSNRLEEPYIFFLYYLRYDPKTYLREGGTKNTEDQSFGPYEFRGITWPVEHHDGKTLYVLAPIDKPKNSPILHTIRYFDGSESILMAQ